MLNLLSDDMRRNPYPMYEQLRSGPGAVFVAPFDAWMVFDYDGVKRALSDHACFSSSVKHTTGSSIGQWLIFMDPPRHTKLRAIVMRAFTQRSIANLEPRIRRISAELLDAVVERGTMDLVSEYAAPLPALVIAEMIGIPPEERPRFMRWNDAVLGLIYVIAGGDLAAQAVKAYTEMKTEMTAYVEAALEERRKAPKDDLLTRLVEAEVDGERLSLDEILGFFQLLLSAGTETTTHLISNAALAFAEFPAQLQLLQETPALLPKAIEEVVRWRSPASVMFRQTTREVELGGQAIPENKFVLAMIGAANRDPKHFADPDRFDITRDPNPHIAFGHGMHFCLGAPLARLEGRLALGDLLARLGDMTIEGADSWEPRKALHVHGPAKLPIRFTPGKRSL